MMFRRASADLRRPVSADLSKSTADLRRPAEMRPLTSADRSAVKFPLTSPLTSADLPLTSADLSADLLPPTGVLSAGPPRHPSQGMTTHHPARGCARVCRGDEG